jgi:hypothetical protein
VQSVRGAADEPAGVPLESAMNKWYDIAGSERRLPDRARSISLRVEARHGFAGARRALGDLRGLRGHLGPPMLDEPKKLL